MRGVHFGLQLGVNRPDEIPPNSGKGLTLHFVLGLTPDPSHWGQTPTCSRVITAISPQTPYPTLVWVNLGPSLGLKLPNATKGLTLYLFWGLTPDPSQG